MTRNLRFRLIALFLCAVALAAAYHQAKTEAVMAETADRFLQSLTLEQKANTLFDFGDKDRLSWHFVPDNSFENSRGYARRGITYNEMDPQQRRLADALLSSGLSKGGFIKALTVMSLEEILRILEKDTTGRRDVEKYHFSVFGKPLPTATWGWRVEGHHLSLNFTMKNGRLASSSPTFFGANPHEVRQGPRSGLRTLASEEDLARTLVRSLDAKQRKQAIVGETAYRDILTRAETRAKLEGEPQGLPASKMDEKQAETLMALIAEYAANMPAEVAEGRMKVARETPPDKLFFAWAGSIEPGKGDYYRVQGPTFLIEYDNTQNKNNHSHTVWRDFDGDFGLDLLALHHRLYNHGLRGGEGRNLVAD